MNLGVIDNLLQKVSLEIEFLKRLPKRFNVFDISDVRHYEIRHSTILAGLLGWNGSRKPLCQFLKKFLNEDIRENEIKDVVVSTEYTINVGDEKRRIDILLQIGKEIYVVIENKVFTDDHTAQLAAYYEWLETQKRNGICKRTYLVYLTLNGSPSSEGFPEDNYIRLSYEKDIIDFLTLCAAITNLDERFNSTVLQYAEFWENWFMKQNEIRENVVKTILSSKENYEAAREVCFAYREAKYQLISETLKKWQEEKNGYASVCKASEITGKQYDKFSFKWNDLYTICFEFTQSFCQGLIYGILKTAQGTTGSATTPKFNDWENGNDYWPAYKSFSASAPQVFNLGENSYICFEKKEYIFSKLDSAFNEVVDLLEKHKDFFGEGRLQK